ncbi:hypothetical protein CHS0354_005987 [Potamilus streckersoni]|uniref:Spindle and kinetochore-associated protein 3 n=1 Tax=Potamilus streckersoni TaxID=2493646 RepID=A0AAE0RP16_9BIVA|nr:hypothetical protein CHS0354_005987 [Potamilus streckersoni]
MAMIDESASFFVKLKSLAIAIDRGLVEIKAKVSGDDDNFCAAHAAKALQDLRKEVKEVKESSQALLTSLKTSNTELERKIQILGAFLLKKKKQLEETEKYFKKYDPDYVTYEENKAQLGAQTVKTCANKLKTEEEVKEDVEEETDREKKTAISTTPEKPTKTSAAMVGCRTPKLEDFGISRFTMQALNKLSKQPSKDASAIANLFEKPRLPPLPPIFEHNGILVTPSLGPGFFADKADHHEDLASPEFKIPYQPQYQSTKQQLVFHDDSTSAEGMPSSNVNDHLASPVPPIFHTPGVKQIYCAQRPPTSESPVLKPNQITSPIPPTFMTPGMKQIQTDLKKNGTKKESEKPPISKLFRDEEPAPPELTFSLEALNQLTSSFRAQPKLPESLADKYGHTVQKTVTPPLPELFSDNLRKMGHVRNNSNNEQKTVKKTFQYGHMPEPPKLLGTYDVLFKENKPPNKI